MKELFTRTLYFKKYDHRLQVKCQSSWNNDPKAPTDEVIRWLLDKKFHGQYRTTVSSDWKKKELRCSVFFLDSAVKDHLQHWLETSQYFVEYEKPLDAQHTKMLGDDEKLLTRKDLFYKKYRVVFRAEPDVVSQGGYWNNRNTTKLREMEQWCMEQFGAGGNNQDVFRVDIWSKGIFYFADSRDAMMFKLVWGGEAKMTTERVVLISELQEQRAREAQPTLL